MNDYKTLFEQVLPRYLPDTLLLPALSYATEGGGKRFRPSLCYTTCALFGADTALAHSASVALECIHAYSLVHDDLPAMDDDDLRRGKPTLHRQFDEATAILTGDALQTVAFQSIADDEQLSPEIKISLLQILGKASFDMVVGQYIDIHGTITTTKELTTLHRLKTGALLSASLLMGGVVAQIDKEDYASLETIGQTIGLAYQVQDDVLDLLGSEVLGKSSGSDDKNNKITFVSTLGEEGARNYFQELYAQALELIDKLSVDAKSLAEIVKIMQNRGF